MDRPTKSPPAAGSVSMRLGALLSQRAAAAGYFVERLVEPVVEPLLPEPVLGEVLLPVVLPLAP